jgi:hypothetical protein
MEGWPEEEVANGFSHSVSTLLNALTSVVDLKVFTHQT